jgi:hypothetical protein
LPSTVWLFTTFTEEEVVVVPEFRVSLEDDESRALPPQDAHAMSMLLENPPKEQVEQIDQNERDPNASIPEADGAVAPE